MISIKDLQKVIDQNTVIDIESLEIDGGEIAAIIGPVDSGIDTLVDLLLGAMHPTMGSIKLAGIDPHKERKLFSRFVGVLFSGENLYERQSPRGNLKFFARLGRLPKDRVTEVDLHLATCAVDIWLSSVYPGHSRPLSGLGQLD